MRYFRDAPPDDAVWAMFFLTGRRFLRLVNTRQLREWACKHAAVPLWLLDESYESVGDLSETIALLLPEVDEPVDETLAQVVRDRLQVMQRGDDTDRRRILSEVWERFDATERFLFHKLISGVFRVGVARTLVVRALAEVAAVEPAVMDHRLLGNWDPTPETYARIMAGKSEADPARPYPFFLAYSLDVPAESLGDVREWQFEWKWDGIRAQLIRRAGHTLIWSRGEELVTDGFPEIVAAGRGLPDGTVIDGEIVAFENERVLPFALLQHRIHRKRVQPQLWHEVPVALLAFDLLEREGADLRANSLEQRRTALEELVARRSDPGLRTSPLLAIQSWSELSNVRQTARAALAEGIMLKRRAAAYGAGRRRGDWWKWKIDPYTIDAVLMYAQAGSGKRAGIFTDYTFGVWENGELTPFAKAYSGLTDEEIGEVDSFVRANTVERFGPVRAVKPELVFEIAFEGIQQSTRHRGGIAVRFPRITRWRHDKKPADADTMETVRALLESVSRMPEDRA